jgi:hypothetical protein
MCFPRTVFFGGASDAIEPFTKRSHNNGMGVVARPKVR